MTVKSLKKKKNIKQWKHRHNSLKWQITSSFWSFVSFPLPLYLLVQVKHRKDEYIKIPSKKLTTSQSSQQYKGDDFVRYYTYKIY